MLAGPVTARQHHDEDRGIFRPEMLAYQRNRRTFGEPLDTRALPAWYCVIPVAALALTGLLLARLEYQPRLDARLVAGPDGGTTFLIPADEGQAVVLRTLRPGQTLEVEADGQIRRLTVQRAGARSCGPFTRCWEVGGQLAPGVAPGALRIDSNAILRFPPRPLLPMFRRDAGV
jgi:hypothetical protein